MLPYFIGRLHTAPTKIDAFFGYLVSVIILWAILQSIYAIVSKLKK